MENLSSLIVFLGELASTYPSFADEIEIQKNGYSKNDINQIKNDLPNIPEDFLETLCKIKIDRVSIGVFELSPIINGVSDFKNYLSNVNRDPLNPFLGFFSKNSLIEIGRVEANLLCIGVAKSKYEGNVFLIDITSSDIIALKKLADSYEEVLVLAGNLLEICIKFEDCEQLALEEFNARLKRMSIIDEVRSNWIELLEENI